ncbi:unnamed protein product, partial [Ectocarpus sp. 8 AP-2014]
VKVREEADPFSMDLGSVKKGDIVKVLETSKLWVRVCYRGREDGWVLTANKRGPTLVPSEDQASAAGEFDAQEEAFASSNGGAVPEDPSDRPLTGAKPPPAAPTAATGDSEDRPLTGGGKDAWASAGSVVDAAGQGKDSAGDEAVSSEYMTALGFVKVREEADPFSMDLGSVKRGDVVKVLETSKLWARVCYRGREDGWVLTANKRGPTLVPSEDQASAAGEFDAQEEAFAASNGGAVPEGPRMHRDSFSHGGTVLRFDLGSNKSSFALPCQTSKLWVRVCYRGREDGWVLTANKRGPTLVPSEDQDSAAGEFDAQEAAFAAVASSNGGAVPEDPADRPLTGAKPPPAAPTAASGSVAGDGDERALTGGGKGAWVPPSEFPPGQEGPVGSGDGGDALVKKASAGSVVDAAGQGKDSGGDEAVSSEYMTALGFVKVREEADPFSMDLGSVKKGDIVKVLETSKLWARVCYRGREDGWVLTANKRGPTLVPSEDQDSAAGEFDVQEAAFAASSGGAVPEDPSDRPLTGAKPPPAAPTAATGNSEDRPLSGGGKGAWVPPSEFPPGQEDGPASSGGSGDVGDDAFSVKPSAGEGVDEGGQTDGSAGGEAISPEYLTALGFVKVREEADPFSMDLGSVKKGDIVKVLETSKLWVRVCYRGREDGWVLTANKRGPTLVPSEDQDSAAGEFDAQEAAFASSNGGAVPEDPADRPLTGAKPPPAAATVATGDSEDRPLTGGGKGAWVPPSEFPPGQEGPVGSGDGGDALVKKASAGSVVDAAGQGNDSAGDEAVSSEYMTALGFVKVREEADPFSMDLGSAKKGDIVKVLETSKLWVRVCYRGREDGWVLTANKRGPTLVPSEDQASAAGEFDAQEAAFASSSGGAVPEDPSDRPLTGAKPPSAAPTAATGDSEDRALSGGGKGAWVPPSEFPPGQEDGPVGRGDGGDALVKKASVGSVVGAVGQGNDSAGDETVSSEYMTALGFVKVREEADPFSMDLGSVKKGDVVKVLETSKLWVRVCYRGREDGWVLTANKRGPTLVPSEDQASAAGEFDAQEAAFAASNGGAVPEDPSDRPLTGAKPPPAAPTAATGDGEDRPLTGGGKGAWVPPSEFPPGQEDGPVGRGDGCGGGGAKPSPAPEDVADARKQADSSAGGAAVSSEYMTALGFVKVREEADPFSMDLGSVKKGDIVKVLETSKLWVRVCYRGREDGWVLTANKRGPTLVPSEDQDSAAGEFDVQEAAFAAVASSNGGAVPEDPSDRPLTGAKPPSAARTAASGSVAGDGDERALTGGGKGAWVPPSEFPPGQEGPGGSGDGGDALVKKASAGSVVDAAGQGNDSAGDEAVSSEYMTALGFVKVREEADPFSMDLGSVKKGDIVKVLETSKLWARVCYRGREDGWVLTANKRGPTLVPSEDQASAAGEFDVQEAAFAASNGGAVPEDPADRPLTGAKPPPAAPTAATGDSEDRPLTGGGKGAWVPPSEFPPGQEDGPVSYGAGGGSTGGVTPGPEGERPLRAAQKAEGGEGAASGGAVSGGDAVHVEYMKALGVIKLREEADPFSMDLGVVQKDHVVKVLEMKGLWARVGYRGKTDGWVLTENKRGKMLTAAEDQEEAEAVWAEQEQNASQDDRNDNVPPASRDDRPIGGKRSNQHDGFDPRADGGGLETTGAASSPSGNGGGGVLDTSSQAAVGTDGGPAEPPAGGLKPWQRRRKVASSRKPAAEQGGEDQAEAAAAPPAKPWQRRGAAKSDPLADGTEEAVTAAAPAKPWQGKKAGALPKGSTAEVGGSAGDEAGDSAAAAGEAAASVKPWLKKKRPGGGVRAGAIDDGGSGDKPGGDDAVVAKPWEAAARAASETVEEAAVMPEGVGRGAGEGGGSAGGEDGLAGLEACLEERDWKKRVAVFEAASRACRSRVEGAAGTVGPLLPRMLQDKNVQAVDAAVDTLTAYLSLRSTMGAEEGSSLASALAERALCCGRAPVEAKADAAAATLLAGAGGSGGLARRGAWLTLAARAGGLENEFFPPAGEEGGRGRSKVAAAAPKAVTGCVRAISAGMEKGGAVVAGGGDSRKEVYSAAKAMLGSSKLPVKMAGISLSGALYAAEGDAARDALGVEDMEARIKCQLERAFADADSAAAAAVGSGNTSPVAEEPLAAPASPPIRPPATPTPGGGGGGGGGGGDGSGSGSGAIDLLSDDDGNLELLTPPPPVSRVPEQRLAEPWGGGGDDGGVDTGDEGVAPLGGNEPAEAAKSGIPESTVDDELWSEDDDDEDGGGRGGLESDDHYKDAAKAAAAAGGTAVESGSVNDNDDDLLDGLSADLPDLRITTSPSEGDGSRAAPPGGAGGVGRAKARLGLGERLSSERGLAAAAAAAAAAETPRRLSTPGYRGSAKKRGARTAVERETQFLGTQMLVLPERERSAWDDILDDMLLKAPTADPLRWSQHRLSADGAPGIVGPGGGSAPHGARPDEEDALKLMPPPPPAVSSSLPSGASSSSSSSALLRPDSLRSVGDDEGAGSGSGRGSLGFEVGSDSDDLQRRMSWREERRRQPQPAPLSLPQSLPASFGLGEEDGTVSRPSSESRPSWNEQQQQRQEMLAVRSSADESVRERMARLSARRRQSRQAPTPQTGEEPFQKAPADGAMDDGEGGAAANVVATAGRRHLLRGPGSWTSGIGSGSGPGGVRSPRLSRAGHGGG